MTDNNTALKKAGLKVTLPRLKILEVLQEPDNHHVSAEDLYKRLIDMGEEIGLATVYRVLNQFDDAGIVTRHNFEGGKSVFELTQQHHHDHLICLDCGKVIEFSDVVVTRKITPNISATHWAPSATSLNRAVQPSLVTGQLRAIISKHQKVWQMTTTLSVWLSTKTVSRN